VWSPGRWVDPCPKWHSSGGKALQSCWRPPFGPPIFTTFWARDLEPMRQTDSKGLKDLSIGSSNLP
jgi:hypothetical protein